MLKGFKEFIARGNVIELAVGVIIGAAFKSIVDSLVDNVINPLIGMIFGKPDFSNMLIIAFNGSELKFGALLTAVINFLIIAFALYFFLVLPMNALNKRNKKAEDDAPKEISDEVQLLTEIPSALPWGDRALLFPASRGLGGRLTAPPPPLLY